MVIVKHVKSERNRQHSQDYFEFSLLRLSGTVLIDHCAAPVWGGDKLDDDQREKVLSAIEDLYTATELQHDIVMLYDRGYSRAFRALPARFGAGLSAPAPETLTADEARAALRAAGFSDAEISDRDYSRASEIDA